MIIIKKRFLNSNQHIRMISEESCDPVFIQSNKQFFSLITLFQSEMCHVTEVSKLHMTIHVDFKEEWLSICMWIRGSDSCVALLQSSPSGEGAGGDTTPFSCSREACAIVMLLHRKHSTCIHPIRHTAHLTCCMHTQTNKQSDTTLISFPTIQSILSKATH